MKTRLRRSPTREQVDSVRLKLVEDYQQTTIPVTSCVLVLLSYLLSGGAIFSAWEDWTFLDGAYFCFVSLMTIGFGDFGNNSINYIGSTKWRCYCIAVPGNYYIYNIDQNISAGEANAKIILGSLYILFGMGLIGMCVNLMQEKIFFKVIV